TMDQARTTISKIFNGEPRSYTRFNLTQNMEGDNSHVEMKLSSDMDDEVEANGVGENTNQHNRPYYPSKLNQRSPKTVCGCVIGILILFIIGYLIGYLCNRSTDKTEIKSDCPVFNEITPVRAEPVYSLDWSDLRALLKKKLTTNNINSNLKEFSSASHQAGSTGDEALANKIMGKFKTFGMSTWTDEHYVKIHEPGSSNNRVLFRGNVVGTTEGYLAYSALKTVQVSFEKECILFCIFYSVLNADINGKVVLVRAGLLSFAEKVSNAASMNASAVLIYPDPVNYNIKEDTALFGHVHLGTGDPYTPGFPSFNHTQFPPAQSSGLPSIPAQTITIRQATEIMRCSCTINFSCYLLSLLLLLIIKNVLIQKKIHNVFGVIKGYMDKDRYMVIGAQRDAWGPGYARSTVGTSLLVELARTITDMIKNDGFKPKRSIIFASWSAGEFGSVGATEWLEGYLTSLNLKMFSYVSLDEVISGFDTFKAAASPLLYELLENTMKQTGRLPSTVTMQWLLSAQGSYDRAASALVSAIRNSDLDDMEQCRIINNRIMRVEGSFLSPYVSPRESLFRHILLGSGSHTLAALVHHLEAIKGGLESADIDQFKNQFALATWTIQGCANALAGEVWDMDNEI
uniref:Transferrin receptor protein 1 n=1 Tax=Cyprinus carpio TaxID=7962 RepID=A0A8C2DR43_CYPCA